jgi:hypothetical protein
VRVEHFGLGAYLIDQGAITKQQLEEALQAQVVSGGRLGTNLVELGILDLDALGRHLSALCDVPLPPKGWVEKPDPKALQLIPRAVAERDGVLALRLEGTKLHLALLDPSNQALVGRLTRTTGRSLVVYVLPELRLRYAIEKHAGIVRPLRLMNVAKKLETVRRTAAAERDERPEEIRLREALGIKPLAANEDLIDESSFAQLHQKLACARERAAGGPAAGMDEGEEEVLLDQVEEVPEETAAPGVELPSDPVGLEAVLAAAPDRDVAARAALALARMHFEAAALLVVHRGMVMGLRGAGGELESRIEGVLVPLDAESVFAQVATSNQPYRGAPPNGALDGRVLRALGRGAAVEIAILPIALRGRVVNLLYVDAGAQPLAETALGAASALTTCVSRAYERLILALKSG